MSGLVARAGVTITVARNDPRHATADFKFDTVPSPSKDDAATQGKFTIVDGEQDENGGGLESLNDGLVPDEADQPDANFFLAGNGGRLLLDLGSEIDIKQVNTYSWHPNTRGPQVYKLYISDGTAQDFDAKPRRGLEPEKRGWKFVTAVDTRPKQGPMGGQYGVSITDSTGSIGHARYLLFDIAITERDDPFGNTFYSEIDVIDKSELLADVPATGPADPGDGSSPYQIVINTDEVPEMKPWADQLRPILEKWYPILVKSLPSPGFTAPRRFTVTFRKDKPGVADTAGTHVNCAASWFKQHPDDEGAVVHEMVHVVQQYHWRGNPGWMTEGIADYFRWFVYEPPSARPHPDPHRAKYTDGYRVTAAFLDYIVRTHDKNFVVEMNAAMRQGKYQPQLWEKYAGKNLDDLWNEYIATLRG
jgi:hypothetical protein